MKNKVITHSIGAMVLANLFCAVALAQDMPPPRSMPRIPVARENVMGSRPQPALARQVQGGALIIDGEKLRVAENDLRLFGIVPPQLAASFGPQARGTLDALTAGQNVVCQIRDRDRDGRLLATCMAGNADLALELLKRGLAVTARGSLASSEYLASYVAAEEGAQNQKIGLWSVAIPAAAKPAAAPAALPTPAAMPTPAPVTTTEAAPQISQPQAPIAAPPVNITPAVTPPVPAPAAAPAPASLSSVIKEDKKVTASVNSANNSANQKITQELVTQQAQAHLDENFTPLSAPGFFERYQILLAGLLMLTTALTLITAVWVQKRRDKRDEIKSIAAALRGELMAARGVCMGRVKSITNEDEDRAAMWPRIRATLYTAYVGRLGLLGAELARQISSIYGQSSDYAAFYTPSNPSQGHLKKQALETLTRYIDDVLPKLNTLERSGSLSAMSTRYAGSMHASNSLSHRSPLASMQNPAPDGANFVAFSYDIHDKITDVDYQTEETRAPLQIPALSPRALWESVRGLIQNHRNAINETEPAPTEPDTAVADSDVSEYADLIEADIARYHQRREMAESLEASINKTKAKANR